MASFGISQDDVGGFVVIGLWTDDDGFRRWHPLRAFGYHQGDAMAFKELDCPTLSHGHLRQLAKLYNPTKIWRRIRSNKFVIDKGTNNKYTK